MGCGGNRLDVLGTFCWFFFSSADKTRHSDFLLTHFISSRAAVELKKREQQKKVATRTMKRAVMSCQVRQRRRLRASFFCSNTQRSHGHVAQSQSRKQDGEIQIFFTRGSLGWTHETRGVWGLTLFQANRKRLTLFRNLFFLRHENSENIRQQQKFTDNGNTALNDDKWWWIKNSLLCCCWNT